MARVPLAPSHPERTCWGCDKYCPADDLRCGNGTVRTMHPLELFGEDWVEWVTSGSALSRAATGATRAPEREPDDGERARARAGDIRLPTFA